MRKHKKNRGHTPQAVGHLSLPPRRERHGEPMADHFVKPEIVRISRGVRINPTTGEAEAYSERQVLSPRRPMTPKEIDDARTNVKRAVMPTTKYGRRNTGGKEQPR